MLQFGDVPITQNSISKSRNPRNIWDRQSQSVASNVSSGTSDNVNQVQATTTNSPNKSADLVLTGNTSKIISGTTADFVTVTSDIIITDLNGKILMLSSTATLDLSSLNPGFYSLNVITPQGSIYKKILKF